MSSTVAAGIQVSLVLLWQGGRILLLWLRRNCLCCFFWLNLILLFIMLLLQSWGKSCCCEEKQTLLLRERATGEEIFVAHVAEKMRDVDCWRAVSTASDNWSCRHDWGKQSLLLLTLLKQVIVSLRDCKGIAHSGWEEMLVMVEGWRLKADAEETKAKLLLPSVESAADEASHGGSLLWMLWKEISLGLLWGVVMIWGLFMGLFQAGKIKEQGCYSLGWEIVIYGSVHLPFLHCLG